MSLLVMISDQGVQRPLIQLIAMKNYYKSINEHDSNYKVENFIHQM